MEVLICLEKAVLCKYCDETLPEIGDTITINENDYTVTSIMPKYEQKKILIFVHKGILSFDD